MLNTSCDSSLFNFLPPPRHSDSPSATGTKRPAARTPRSFLSWELTHTSREDPSKGFHSTSQPAIGWLRLTFNPFFRALTFLSVATHSPQEINRRARDSIRLPGRCFFFFTTAAPAARTFWSKLFVAFQSSPGSWSFSCVLLLLFLFAFPPAAAMESREYSCTYSSIVYFLCNLQIVFSVICRVRLNTFVALDRLHYFSVLLLNNWVIIL